MTRCPACQAELPSTAKFCGFCGFRQAPISKKKHRELSKSYSKITGEEVKKEKHVSARGPIPLTKRKKTPTSSKKTFRHLLVVDNTTVERTEEYSKREIQAAATTISAPVDSQSPRPAPVIIQKKKPPRRALGNVIDSTVERPLANKTPHVEQRSKPKPVDRTQRPTTQSRQAKRFPLKVEVGLNSEHNFYTGFMENLSSGGLFVATHEEPDIGEKMEISFTVPGLNRTCVALCQVRWVREYNSMYPDMVPGVGLKFIKLDPEAQAAIELFIKHRDPIFFDDE